MRVGFLGTADFGIPVLQHLLYSKHDVVGVVTGPDKRAGRGRKSIPTPVRKVADAAGLPVLTPIDLKDPEFVDAFRRWDLDTAVVVAFRILPRQVFSLPKHGILNVHPSLLPRYRGPAPIPWALINGDKETGVSVIRISAKVDAGGILLQRRTAIGDFETTANLIERLGPVGADMILEALDKMESNTLEILPQREEEVTRAPKLCKEDGELDWTVPAFAVHNRVRAMTPWPGAYSHHQGKLIKLFGSEPVLGDGQPGEILEAGKRLVVACGENAVAFQEIQREGKRKMTCEECTRGYVIQPGELFR